MKYYVIIEIDDSGRRNYVLVIIGTVNSLMPSDACIDNLNIIGSDNGFFPGRRQVIIWTNAGLLLTGPHRNKPQLHFNRSSYMYIFFQENEMYLKMSSVKW